MMTTRTPLPSIRSSRRANPSRLSIGSAPLTATSANSSTSSNPAVFEKAAIAARWRSWLSPSALVAELVRS